MPLDNKIAKKSAAYYKGYDGQVLNATTSHTLTLRTIEKKEEIQYAEKKRKSTCKLKYQE